MSQLESDLKTMIVDVLGLEDIKPDEIGSDENLFDEDGLALDSIDALELGVNIQKRYGVKIDPQDKNLAAHFKSVKTIAAFIGARQSA